MLETSTTVHLSLCNSILTLGTCFAHEEHKTIASSLFKVLGEEVEVEVAPLALLDTETFTAKADPTSSFLRFIDKNRTLVALFKDSYRDGRNTPH